METTGGETLGLADIYAAVREGRLRARGGYAWACPLCGSLLLVAVSAESRDRRALDHCLGHARVFFDRCGRLAAPRRRAAGLSSSPDLAARRLGIAV